MKVILKVIDKWGFMCRLTKISNSTLVSKVRLGVRAMFALLVMCFAATVQAHNNVVVVPLGGDDVIVSVPAPIIPTTPVTNVDTVQGDYTIMAMTVIDNTTTLEWQRQDDGVERNYDDSWDYCANLELDGHNDWRLPRVKELLSIVDYGQNFFLTIEAVAFTNTQDSRYWSATNLARTSSAAWVISFEGGFIDEDSKASESFVRCVR